MNYLITGATGYIGSMLISCLHEHYETDGIVAVVRNEKKAKEMLPDFVRIVQAELDAGAELAAACKGIPPVDYIIHGASATKSLEMKERPVEVIQSIVNTTQNIMELAAKLSVKGVALLSSMEVYGSISCTDGKLITEDEAEKGAVTLLNPRSCYPLAKRMAEHIGYAYYKEYGVPVKIARLAQVFGRGVLPSDQRVFSQFAEAVRRKENIVLHTRGNSMGNYCGIEDALAGILMILHKGAAGEAYNVVREENTMSILQMAELVCDKVAHGAIQVEFDIPSKDRFGYAADTGLRLSGEKLRKLGWQPKQSLLDMYRDMLL